MANKLVQLQDENGNNVFPIPAGGEFYTPGWDTVMDTSVRGTESRFILKGTTGKEYNFFSTNNGCGILYKGPTALHTVEGWSGVRFTEPINNTELGIEGIKSGTTSYSKVFATIVENTGTGPRSRIETAIDGTEPYASLIGIGSSISVMFLHYTAMRSVSSSNPNVWTIFVEANFAGCITAYSGCAEITAKDDLTVPAPYIRYSGNKIATCRHIMRFMY